MSSYWGLEDGTGHRELEDGTGGWLIESATTFLVSNTLELQYDINGLVANTLEIQYDITGVVSNTLTVYYDIDGSASQNLTRQNLAPTLPALNQEVKLVEKTNGPWNYSCFVDLSNMQSGDKVKIRVYRWEPNTSAYSLYQIKTIAKTDLKGKESEDMPSVYAVFIPTERFKLTIEQTAGTVRQYPWELYYA